MDPNNTRCFGKYKVKTPEDLQKRVDSYFQECSKRDKLPNIAGLALAAGLSSRQSILNYYDRDGYKEVLDEAKLHIQTLKLELLDRLGNNNGVMFDLMNNYAGEGYSNRTTQDVNLGGQANNPLKVEATHDLTEAQLERMLAIYDENKTTD